MAAPPSQAQQASVDQAALATLDVLFGANLEPADAFLAARQLYEEGVRSRDDLLRVPPAGRNRCARQEDSEKLSRAAQVDASVARRIAVETNVHDAFETSASAEPAVPPPPSMTEDGKPVLVSESKSTDRQS